MEQLSQWGIQKKARANSLKTAIKKHMHIAKKYSFEKF